MTSTIQVPPWPVGRLQTKVQEGHILIARWDFFRINASIAKARLALLLARRGRLNNAMTVLCGSIVNCALDARHASIPVPMMACVRSWPALRNIISMS